MSAPTGSVNNKRIAKNTLFLYARLLIIMLVSLYSSRIVLQELGVDSYGIFMVVGGIVSLFSFLNNSMTQSTQRYLNYEMGKAGEDSANLKRIFGTSLTIHLYLAGIILLLTETIGLWFVNTQLVIPADKVFAANVVYQTSIAGLCVIILRVPFNAAIIAHEKMGIFAIVSLAEVLLRLGSAFMLMLVGHGRLAFYGCLIFSVQAIIGLTFVIICLRLFKETTLKPVREKGLFREMFSFAGWTMLGSMAWIARNQGVGIILNVFFGPALNAAKGISDQVTTTVHSFTTNFMTAVNPQIIKSYAEGSVRDMELLAFRGIKFSCLILWILILPIILSVNSVLSVWLTTVPAYAPLFMVLILIDCFAGTLFGNPLMTSMEATGKIRNYQIVVSTLLMLVIPASLIAFKLGCSPQTVFYFNILFTLAAGIARMIFCNKALGYSWKFYFKYSFSAILGVVAVSASLSYALKHLLHLTADPGIWLELIILTCFSIASTAAASWMIGLTPSERHTVANLIKKKLHRA